MFVVPTCVSKSPELCTIMSTHHSETRSIFDMSFAVVASVICLGCLLHSLHADCVNRNHSHGGRFEIPGRYPKIVAWSRFIGIISLLSAAIFTRIASWLWDTNQDSSITYILSSYLTTFCWSFGQFCSYLVFIFRLIDVFSNSAVAIPRKTIIYLGTLIVVLQILWTIQLISFYIYRYSDLEHETMQQTVRYLFIMIVIIDCMLTISMAHQYVSRLSVIFKNHISSAHNRYQRMDADQHTFRMFTLRVKIAVLSITSLFSSFIYYIFCIIAEYIYDNQGPLVIVRNLWYQLDIIITCLCLVLLLPKTGTLYERLCCCCFGLYWPLIKGRFLEPEDLNISPIALLEDKPDAKWDLDGFMHNVSSNVKYECLQAQVAVYEDEQKESQRKIDEFEEKMEVLNEFKFRRLDVSDFMEWDSQQIDASRANSQNYDDFMRGSDSITPLSTAEQREMIS